MKNRSSMRDFLFLSVYFMVLALNTWLLSRLEFSFLLVPFILLQGIALIGLVEAFHQAVHLNLLPGRLSNQILGGLLGGFLGMGYFAYRGFHLKHHQTTNSLEDPERLFHVESRLCSSPVLALLLSLCNLFRYSYIVNRAGIYFSARECSLAWVDKLFALIVTAVLLILLVLFPLAWLKVLGLPLLVFGCFEFLMGQSQHYQKVDVDVAPRGAEHYVAGININIPYPLAFMMLFTNLHATHHAKPAIKWYETPARLQEDIRQGIASNPVSLLVFLRCWFTCGVKVNGMAGRIGKE
ncbi:MAG: fatty acid desaturase, partial [Anaerolineales bacterium]